MPMSAHDETDLLTVLHEGALEAPPWSTFLARLRRRVAADHVAIVARQGEANGGAAIEYGADGSAAAGGLRPMAALYRAAPSLYHALRPGRVYTLAEFLPPGDPEHDAYRRAYLAPAELRHLRVMRVRASRGYDGWLIIGRAKADFPAAAGSLLSALGPHLTISMRVAEAIGRERSGAFVASAGLHRLGIGWLTIDAAGRVIDHDGHSSRFFGRTMLLQDAADASAGEEISAILHRPDGRSHALRLSGQPRIDVLIVPLPPGMAAGAAVAAVYVDAEEIQGASTRDARGEALQALFGLSRNEARLADAISRGEPIAASAARIGLTAETARNYSKRIYAKTATSGQADLARLVLTGLAGMA